jgi:hypothetical protein
MTLDVFVFMEDGPFDALALIPCEHRLSDGALSWVGFAIYAQAGWGMALRMGTNQCSNNLFIKRPLRKSFGVAVVRPRGYRFLTI